MIKIRYKTSDGKYPNYSWSKSFNIIASVSEAFGTTSETTEENKKEINNLKKETK